MSKLVASTTLPEGIAEHLRIRIHRGQLSPGDRLPPERELAEELGVARISLREALKTLQAEGYVEIRRGAKGGTFVTELHKPFADWRLRMREQADEFDDITDYRVALESHAATLAAQRRTSRDLTRLRAAIRALEHAHSRAAFRLADSQFHEGVAQAAGSPRLENAIHHTRGELFSPHDLLDYVEPVRESVRDHSAIYSAIRDRDGQLAANRMCDHIELTREQLRAIVFDNTAPDTTASDAPNG